MTNLINETPLHGGVSLFISPDQKKLYFLENRDCEYS